MAEGRERLNTSTPIDTPGGRYVKKIGQIILGGNECHLSTRYIAIRVQVRPSSEAG